MSVQGGGGGKKVPPAWAQRATPSAKAVETKADPKHAPHRTPTDPRATAPKGKDAFEGRFKSTGELKGGPDRLDEAFAHATTVSGIESLVRVLENARGQLTSENRALREQASALVERLVASGFSPAQLQLVRAELLELRRRMAALRKRLHHLQRRLKSAYASAGKTGDTAWAKLLGAQLDKLRRLEPGVSRALLVLQTLEQAWGGLGDGAPILRVHVGTDGAHGGLGPELGASLARMAPGAAASRALVTMLRDGPQAPLAPASAEPVPPALDGVAALVRALLPPRT